MSLPNGASNAPRAATTAGKTTTPPKPTSQTGTLLHEVRQMPLFRQLVPMEAGIGWPIPVRKLDGEGRRRVYLRLPMYGYRPTPERGQGAILYPPFAVVTLRWDTGRPVEYLDLAYTQPWPVSAHPEPVGTFPHDAVRGSRGNYIADRERLLWLYDEMAEYLQAGQGFSADWIESFSGLLRRLVEPGLLPYYRILGGKFYDRFLHPALDSEPSVARADQ